MKLNYVSPSNFEVPALSLPGTVASSHDLHHDVDDDLVWYPCDNDMDADSLGRSSPLVRSCYGQTTVSWQIFSLCLGVAQCQCFRNA